MSITYAQINNAPVNPFGRLVPVGLPRCEFDGIPWAAVAVFDRQRIARENHRHAMKGIVMPRRALARRETEAPNQDCFTSVQRCFEHCLNASVRLTSGLRSRVSSGSPGPSGG